MKMKLKLVFLIMYITSTYVPYCIASEDINLEKKCDRGHPESCNELGKKYETAVPGKSAEYYLKSCNMGNPVGCSGYGATIAKSGGDLNEAIRYFRMACIKDDVRGCKNLGKALIVKNNISEARQYSVKACEMKDPDACNDIGMIMLQYDNNPEKSKKYFQYSCDHKYWIGCGNLGAVYYQVEKKWDVGLPYLEMSCSHGVLKACDIIKEGEKEHGTKGV